MQPVPFPVPPAAPLPSRVYSDASSCKPYWRVAIAAWRQSDPTRADHCDRILDCIENGLPIDPNPLPKNKHLPNTPVIRQHAEAVRTQLQSYQASGAIEQCKRADIIAVHPIHAIVRPARKLRVVVDFSLNLNKSMTVIPMQPRLLTQQFVYPGSVAITANSTSATVSIHSACEQVRSGCWVSILRVATTAFSDAFSSA